MPGWLTRPSSWQAGSVAVVTGGAVSALGAFMFIGNIWLTPSTVRLPAITPLLRTPS